MAFGVNFGEFFRDERGSGPHSQRERAFFYDMTRTNGEGPDLAVVEIRWPFNAGENSRALIDAIKKARQQADLPIRTGEASFIGDVALFSTGVGHDAIHELLSEAVELEEYEEAIRDVLPSSTPSIINIDSDLI